MSYQLIHGDCLDVMAGMAAGSVDAVVTDPPYGLAFMGKHWDHGVPGVVFWAEALAVLKPSCYLLAFGGTRTWHRLACSIEDAGFEIRDTLMWMYGSGFPKGKACLKPAWEPIILARKPGPMRELGIEECRVGSEGGCFAVRNGGASVNALGDGLNGGWGKPVPGMGRWPANVILDEAAAGMVDGAVGNRPSASSRSRPPHKASSYHIHDEVGLRACEYAGDSGGPSRFFYNAKSSSRERNAGVSGLFVTLELEVCPCGESTAQVTSLVRAISEWATGQASQGCSTSSCGSPSSGQYLTVTVSTTSTETSKTTVSKTSPVWTT